MYEITFNQFTILTWWNMATGNPFNHTISTTHHKGSSLICDIEYKANSTSDWCLQWAGNQSQVVFTGYEKPEDLMFKVKDSPKTF